MAVSDAGANVEASTGGRDGSVPPQDGYAWERLEDQLGWYDRKSGQQKQRFQRLKVVQIVMAAAIPVAAGNGAPAWITGSLGAAIVVLEGLQQLFQFQQNWVSYRATAEGLKHEKYLYLSRVGAYAKATRPDALLAERVEQLVSQEQTNWSLAQADAGAHSKA
jgi:predicted phage tail protein